MRRIRSETSATWTPSRKRPSKRSPSSSAVKSWKSASLPLCGVAVISRQRRVSVERRMPEPVALGELERLGAEPLHADDDHDRIRDDAPHRGARLKLFEF